MAVASKTQRAVKDVEPERWGQLGAALQAWREDVLGSRVRGRFAADRGINLRLVQDLEKNYRPGTYTKWALQDAAEAYEVPYAPYHPVDNPDGGPGSILAFLYGEEDALARAKVTSAARPAATDGLGLPPAPMDDPVREAAARPYAEAIWRRYLDLPKRVTEPGGAQMFGEGTPDAMTWDGIGDRLPVPDKVWAIADFQRADADRTPQAGANSA